MPRAERASPAANRSPPPSDQRERPSETWRATIEDELGDVLFSVVNLARHLELDPEAALKRANRKFVRRFQHMEDAARAQGRELNQLAAAEWDAWWRESKMDHP